MKPFSDQRIISCETCDGAGRVECGPAQINFRDGSVSYHEYRCDDCGGTGYVEIEVLPVELGEQVCE